MFRGELLSSVLAAGACCRALCASSAAVPGSGLTAVSLAPQPRLHEGLTVRRGGSVASATQDDLTDSPVISLSAFCVPCMLCIRARSPSSLFWPAPAYTGLRSISCFVSSPVQAERENISLGGPKFYSPGTCPADFKFLHYGVHVLGKAA